MDKRSISLALPAALLLLLLSALLALRTAATEPVSRSIKDVYLMPVSPAGISARPPPLAQTGGAPLLGLVVTATVGLDPDVCAITERILVAPGTRVFYCYRAENTGQVTLTTHTLRDSQAGLIWDRQQFELPPGASLTTVGAGLALGSQAQRNARTDVTWTASPVTPTLVTSATASARVNVVSARVALSKTAGTGATGCAPGTRAVVHAGEDAHFCIVIANTGNMPLVRHTLADPTLELTATFAYTLAPSEQLTITEDTLPNLDIDGTLARSNVTRTLINTAVYTGVTPPDFAHTGPATASGVATATIALADARITLAETVGTSPAVCGDTTSLSISDPNTQLYYCAVLRNTGDITITRHVLAQPRVNLVTAFTRTLVPGEYLSVTNVLLEEMGQTPAFGPYSVYNGANLTLNNAMVYTGLASVDIGQDGETRSYTATASASAFAGVDATPSPTPTATNTPRSSDSRPTNTPWPTPTATWTPASQLATPAFADAQQSPTNTPTRSYAISLLATPTSLAISPLATPEPPVNAAATQEALATLAALEATTTAAAQSPLATPTPTPTETAISLPTETPTPDATGSPEPAVVVVVTNTPDASLGSRPIEYPTPTPTPDYLLAAARAVDAIAVTATWIWFMVGSLVFFVVAGVLAGLSFRQNERQRYDLLNDGLWIDEDFLLPPPPPPHDEDVDDWPDSLP